jgi:hypothetical protein
MRVRVFDLDGSITSQQRLLRTFRPDVFDLQRWGPSLRLACRWGRFHRFERWLDRAVGRHDNREAQLTFLGSGDFHHLTLALLRRLNHPVNLLVLDKHAGWNRGLPFLHCGNWLRHAAQLPNVKRIFHVGGENFDDNQRWLAPKQLLQDDKIVVWPARRRFHRGFWRSIAHQPVRSHADTLIHAEHIEEILWPHLEQLQRWPLFVSLDKDVLWMPESVTNWDSGCLELNEIQDLLDFFLKAAGNELVGMDVVGDWSAVRTQGLLRSFLNWSERSSSSHDANQARLCNEQTNLTLLRFLMQDPAEQRELVSTL